MTRTTYTRTRLLIAPSGRYHADELDGGYIVATPVDVRIEDTGDELLFHITPTGAQVAFPADDPAVIPYEGSGTAADVLTR